MGRFTPRHVTPVAAAVAFLLVSGCGQPSSPGGQDAAGGGASPGTGTAASPQAAVKTATLPGDACGWVPAVDVEQVIGKLEGPPRAAGNECIYPLAEKSKAFASLMEMRRKLGGDDQQDGMLADVVRVGVDPSGGSIVGDLATAAVGKMFAKEFGLRPSDAAEKAAPPPGWDSVGGMPYTWIGRVGHISISVFSPPEITREKKMALAALVRDHIPDLPFAAENTYQVITLGPDRNPCDLLTRAEAEAVLGGLVVDPYRAIEDTSHAYEKGKACAYFTPGHRAFVMTVEWRDGAMTYNLGSGLGALIGAVAPLEKAALEGPWDKGRVDGTSGALMFLKGDRYLRVDYLTSATDRAGALKLAAQAAERLAQ